MIENSYQYCVFCPFRVKNKKQLCAKAYTEEAKKCGIYKNKKNRGDIR